MNFFRTGFLILSKADFLDQTFLWGSEVLLSGIVKDSGISPYNLFFFSSQGAACLRKLSYFFSQEEPKCSEADKHTSAMGFLPNTFLMHQFVVKDLQ